jgi:hypothetical protein
LFRFSAFFEFAFDVDVGEAVKMYLGGGVGKMGVRERERERESGDVLKLLFI